MDCASDLVMGLQPKGRAERSQGLVAGMRGRARHWSTLTSALFILLVTITSPCRACQFLCRLIIASPHVVLSAHGVLSMPDAVTMSEITLLISVSFTLPSYPGSLALWMLAVYKHYCIFLPPTTSACLRSKKCCSGENLCWNVNTIM